VGSRAREREREAGPETPAQIAAKRMEQLLHDADSAATRAAKLSTIALRKEWRTERAELTAKHQSLQKELEVQQAWIDHQLALRGQITRDQGSECDDTAAARPKLAIIAPGDPARPIKLGRK